MLYSMYTANPPEIIDELVQTKEMQRLNGIGMNCGCEYTEFATYTGMEGCYSRLAHSIGVAYIVWNFTGDVVQTVAGLLHDIATPVFAHTIDFLNNDYMKQESTESDTLRMIENSPEIMNILDKYNIPIEKVADYHMYPIADNDTPQLSADRLEYTIGTACLVHKADVELVRKIYEDIAVIENEFGRPELYFKNVESARKFTELSLENSYCFVSHEDRYAMQRLADIMKYAIEHNVITENDLYSTENEVINKLLNSDCTAELWYDYRKISGVGVSYDRPEMADCIKVAAKLRYINPLSSTENGIMRITDYDKELEQEIYKYLCQRFDIWVYEKRRV